MSQFKEGLSQKYNFQLHGDAKLRYLVALIDDWTRLFFNEEIVITSAIRPISPGKKSYHPIGRAVDLRTKDVPELAVSGWQALISFVNSQRSSFPDFEGKFTWLWEDKGGDNEHFHLQYKKGEPV